MCKQPLSSRVNATGLNSGCKTYLSNLKCKHSACLLRKFLIGLQNYLVSRSILSSETETTMVRDQDRDRSKKAEIEPTKNRFWDRDQSRDLQSCEIRLITIISVTALRTKNLPSQSQKTSIFRILCFRFSTNCGWIELFLVRKAMIPCKLQSNDTIK